MSPRLKIKLSDGITKPNYELFVVIVYFQSLFCDDNTTATLNNVEL